MHTELSESLATVSQADLGPAAKLVGFGERMIIVAVMEGKAACCPALCVRFRWREQEERICQSELVTGVVEVSSPSLSTLLARTDGSQISQPCTDSHTCIHVTLSVKHGFAQMSLDCCEISC